MLFVRDEAQVETEEIKARYESKSSGLGDRFTNALEETYQYLCRTPFYQMRKNIFRHAQPRSQQEVGALALKEDILSSGRRESITVLPPRESRNERFGIIRSH